MTKVCWLGNPKRRLDPRDDRADPSRSCQNTMTTAALDPDADAQMPRAASMTILQPINYVEPSLPPRFTDWVPPRALQHPRSGWEPAEALPDVHSQSGEFTDEIDRPQRCEH